MTCSPFTNRHPHQCIIILNAPCPPHRASHTIHNTSTFHLTSTETAETTIAFHAYHSTDPFSVAAHGTIVYNAVTTNIGNAYDPKNGFFTAPVSGAYVFFVNCMSTASKSEEPSILVNGNVVATCFSNMPQGSPSEQGGTLTTVHLNRGDKVWVRLLENAENVRGNRWNTFSGFLVRADSQ